MNTSTLVGVALLTDVGPRLVSQFGRSLTIASYKLSAFDVESCSFVRVVPAPPLDPLFVAALAQASTRVAPTRPIVPRIDAFMVPSGNGDSHAEMSTRWLA